MIDHVLHFWSLWNVYFQFDHQPCLTIWGRGLWDRKLTFDFSGSWLGVKPAQQSVQCSLWPSVLQGKKPKHILGKSRKMTFPLYSQRRKWNQGQVLYWHHGNSFLNHFSEFVLSFLLHASRCNLNRIFDTLLFWSNKTFTWFSVGHGWLASRCYISSSDFISVI